MKKTLDKKWQDKLAGLPEDGMGYQRVTVIFADGGVREDVLVVNGQECELPDGDAGREIKDIRASGGLEANWIEEEPPVMNEAERRRRIRKKIDDAILALPKPVHVETLMSSGKGPVPTKVIARLNNLISSLGITGYTMRQIMDDVDDGSESRSRRCGSSLSKFDKKKGIAEFSSVCLKEGHKQTVEFEDFETVLELAAEDGVDIDGLEGTALFADPTVGSLLKESNVRIFCNCKSYKYTFAYLAYSLGFGELGDAWDSPPNIRNPNYEGVCCKHLVSVYDHYFK